MAWCHSSSEDVKFLVWQIKQFKHYRRFRNNIQCCIKISMSGCGGKGAPMLQIKNFRFFHPMNLFSRMFSLFQHFASSNAQRSRNRSRCHCLNPMEQCSDFHRSWLLNLPILYSILTFQSAWSSAPREEKVILGILILNGLHSKYLIKMITGFLKYLLMFTGWYSNAS